VQKEPAKPAFSGPPTENVHVRAPRCRSTLTQFDMLIRARPVGRRSQGESGVQYILFIYANETEFNSRPAQEIGLMSQEYMKLTKELQKSDQLRAGERLQPTATATTVRVREGKTLTTDGPFAETREQLGGFYIVEAENLDAAVSIAARVPGARIGSIEVRPIAPMPG
jgi:hypothetical protein